MENEVLLEIKDLKKYFPIKGGLLGRVTSQLYAVDGINLKLRVGETLGLVGESGCGKSTLGRTILRLYEPTDGEIIFQGENLTKISQSQLRPKRKDMQIIFQDPYSSLNPRMTIAEILSEPFIIHKTIPKKDILGRVQELMKLVGLPQDGLDRYPHEFSGGQRQRIGIARSIALNPKLIIADEPVSALDVSIQSQILNLLVDLKKKFNLSYIFIAHDLAVIEHISDQVAVMYLGKIVEYTSAENLYRSPMHPYTKALIASIPIPDVNIKREKKILLGDVPSPISPPKGCHFHPRCSMATDICRTTAPALRDAGQKGNPHLVSCHLA